ncbi:MAG TPA: PPC domain-containing protein [Pirellulales bacterium]|nr:PPC domain-containing protein [Pirellulales bacterium]
MRSANLAAVFLTLGWLPVAAAAPPDVKYLYPAGATRGTTVEVVAGGNAGDGPAQAWVSRSGMHVAPVADKKGTFSIAVSPDAPPGLYWVRIHNAEGAAAPVPFVVDTLPNVNEQEPNDTVAKAQSITTPGCTVNGRLEKRGDVDVFAVSLKQNQTLVAAVTANGTLGSPMDSVLQVVMPRGSVLDQNDDERGLDSLLAFEAPADGTYLVRIFAFPAAPMPRFRSRVARHSFID